MTRLPPSRQPFTRGPWEAGEEHDVAHLLDRVAESLQALGERIAACERRDDVLAEALAALRDTLQVRSDELLDEVNAARVASATPAGTGDADYRELVGRIRRLVRRLVPGDARVLVVSRGDDDLLRLSGRTAGHFPQDAVGDYLGHHPADDAAAVAHLTELVAAGWQYLVLPQASFWWLDHYVGLRARLERACATVHRDADTCVIWALDRPGPWLGLAALVTEFHRREGRFPAILDWETGHDLAAVFPECAVFTPLDAGLDALPYIDASIDLVAVRLDDEPRLAEARRVASHAVLSLGTLMPGSAGGCVVIEHLDDGPTGRRG